VVIVRFVDIGGIVEHYCFNLSFHDACYMYVTVPDRGTCYHIMSLLLCTFNLEKTSIV
jgi:hypothetical protein